MAVQLLMAAMAAGAGLDAFGKYLGYPTEVDINKSRMTELTLQQKVSGAAGAEEAFQRRETLRKTLSRNIARTAAAGAVMEGSPIQAQLNAIDDAAYDITAINYNTAIKDRSFRQQIVNLKYANKVTAQAGKLGVASSLIGGGSKIGQTAARNNLINNAYAGQGLAILVA